VFKHIITVQLVAVAKRIDLVLWSVGRVGTLTWTWRRDSDGRCRSLSASARSPAQRTSRPRYELQIWNRRCGRASTPSIAD